MTPVAKEQDPELTALAEAFGVFSKQTERLQSSHEELKTRVAELTDELARKNRELVEKIGEIDRLRALEERMQRSKRLAALGERAAGVAHEVRNPLGGIELYAGLLARDLEGDEEKRSLAEKIITGTRYLDRIVEGMLDFTREMEVERRRVDLRAVIEQAVELAGAALRDSGVEVVREGAGELAAFGDGELLRRVFLNIVTNACQAMSGGGRLVITCRPETVHGSPVAVCEFADSGPGVSEEAMDRVFNPFFTAREGGTGLGLAISHRIVEAHGGEISVRNNPGGGACFTVRLEGWAE